MGKRRSGYMVPAVQRDGHGSINARHERAQWTLPIFAIVVSLTFILVPIVDPSAAFAMANAPVTVTAPGQQTGPTQTVTAGEAAITVSRDQFAVIKLAPPPPPPRPVGAAPSAGTPDPGSAKAIAHDMVMARGWGEDQYSCLVSLWQKESSWNTFASNGGSGAYGIPQALPGSKMASAGADWQTNPATQITWGLGYITGRYGTPCGAWATSEAKGWY